jgi:3'-phosphoadenosine 5'-phosphosulfate (PAPS) 3'-phosphatase
VKIFGIGLSKTGTTSLAEALTILGYPTKDNPGLSRYVKDDLSSIDARVLDDHIALTDTPIPSFYRELDARFPDAKFILTVRDKEGWLASCKKQFTQKLADKQNEAHNQLFMDLYDSTVFEEGKFAAGYDRFVSAVLEHFRDRPGKLLVMNVTAGDGWEKLCPFLGRPIPDIPFPKANVTRIQWMQVTDLVEAAQRAGAILLRTETALRIDRDGPAQGATLFALLARRARALLVAARGGRDRALARAEREVHESLVASLAKLNREIPVISRLSTPPYDQRRKWSHYWLVDPLDGSAGFATNAGEYSVNVALIENRRPIYGVVYSPRSDTAYYATAGKPAMKVVGHAQPTTLSASNQADDHDTLPPPASKALRICLLGEGSGIASEIADAMDWHVAAAHAVAAACGKMIRPARTPGEVAYNGPTLSQGCVTVA